jgi:hypothetical protein
VFPVSCDTSVHVYQFGSQPGAAAVDTSDIAGVAAAVPSSNSEQQLPVSGVYLQVSCVIF